MDKTKTSVKQKSSLSKKQRPLRKVNKLSKKQQPTEFSLKDEARLVVFWVKFSSNRTFQIRFKEIGYSAKFP